MKIVADDKIPFLQGVFEPFANVVYLPGLNIKKKDVQDADILIVRTRTRCDENLLSGTAVKLIATPTIGTNHLDIPWLEAAGIKWFNAPGCNSGSVYQYITSILSLLINNGLIPEETTIGIVGVGMIGSKIEKFAKILGFNLLLNDPPREKNEQPTLTTFVNFETILKQSNIIIFCTTLTFDGDDPTYHLFDFNALDIIKDGSIIINTSRGEVINGKALIKGIDSGKISKVALDVWENEPDISLELLNKTWVATPHVAGFSADGKANGTTMIVRKISRFCNLKLDNWKPNSIPLPECTTIKIEKSNKKPYQIVAETILKTYNPKIDDALLRSNPLEYEKIRNNHLLRREFETWNVELPTDNCCMKMLNELGFHNAP